MGGVGPMFGQFGHFYRYAKDKCDHPYPEERYANEAMRLLKVIDNQLSKHQFIAGEEPSIADFSIAPWVLCLSKFYEADVRLKLDSYKNINRWTEKLLKRPGFQRGLEVCAI